MLIKMSVSISISYKYIMYKCMIMYNGCIKNINCIKLLAMARTGVSDWAAGR